MNGATVDMTITVLDLRLRLMLRTTAAGISYYEKLVINCGDGTQNIRILNLREVLSRNRQHADNKK